MALRTPEKPDEYNPTPNEPANDFQNIVDQNFSPGDQKAMEERSVDGAAEDIKNSSNSTADDLLNGEQGADFNDKKGDLEDQEKSGDASWSTNVSAKGVRKIKGVAKNSKIIFAMIGVSFAVLGLIFSILSGAMGIVQIKENMLSKMSQRSADALERRKAKVMAKKFSNDITRGVCSSTVKVKCRYRGMSDKEIKKFNKRAERAGLNYRIDSDGRSTNPLKKSIKIIEIDPKTGKETSIGADKYKDLVKNKPEFRKAFNAFYKGNVQYHAGRAGSFVLAKFKVYRGKIKAPKGEGDNDEEKRKSSLRELVRKAVSGETGKLESAKIPPTTADDGSTTVDGGDGVNEEVRNIIDSDVNEEKSIIDDYSKNGDAPVEGSDAEQNRYKSIIEKVKGMGGGVSGWVGNPVAFAQKFCMVRMIAAAASSAKSVLQSAQLIKFSMQYAVLADQIKAGDADSGTMKSVGLLMGMLSTKDERGYTGFDSLGYNWVMSSKGAVGGTLNENVGRYQNGGYAAGTFGSVVTGLSKESSLKSICGVAMSKTVTYISIGATLIPGLGTIFKTGASKGISELFKKVVTKSLDKKVEDIIDKQVAKTVLKKKLSQGALVAGGIASSEILFNYALPPIVNGLSKSIAGTVVTGDEKGTDAGNALVSGFGATTSQTGKAQGMMPLNPDRAVATDNFAYQNQLKLAKEDGINQFDFTNRFSFANQFATNMLPLQAKFSSLTSIPTALSNISSSALSLSFSEGASAATDKKKQYTYCTDADEVYSEKNIATDPMCNPIYGLPAAVKDIDPEEVTDYLYDQGLITEEGEPQGGFTTFIEQCITSQTPYGDSDDCLKGGGLDPKANHLSDDDKKYAMMRLYCIDTSIDVDMNDGEGVSCIPKVESGDGSASTSESSSGSEQPSDTIDIATLYNDSSSISCAEGTKDLGVVDDAYHAGSKFKARLCAVESVPETGDLSDVPGAGGKLVVNSRVSAILVKMVNDAKAAGVSGITAAEGYRSMARQTYLYTCGCTGGNPVAKPGTSNHQAGVAIDWNEPMNSWMKSNGEKYGYKWYGPGDPPHFSPEGN